MSTASDQYFLSYVKKTTGGGQIDPPPAGIGLSDIKKIIGLEIEKKFSSNFV